MVNNRLLLNLGITILYFVLFMFLLWNVSGGDIFLLFLFGCFVIIHCVILVSIYFKRKQLLYKSLLGVLFGVIISLLIYKSIDVSKSHKEPQVEVTQ